MKQSLTKSFVFFEVILLYFKINLMEIKKSQVKHVSEQFLYLCSKDIIGSSTNSPELFCP